LGDEDQEWGRLQLFTDPAAFAEGGLGDARLDLSSRLLPNLQLRGAIHRFWAPEFSTGRGTEGDLEAEWALSPMVAILGGGGYFLGDPGHDSHRLGWVQVDATF
jgi:hypothetical protein